MMITLICINKTRQYEQEDVKGVVWPLPNVIGAQDEKEDYDPEGKREGGREVRTSSDVSS